MKKTQFTFNDLGLFANKYVLCTVCFIIWVVFIDSRSIVKQQTLNKTIISLEKELEDNKIKYDIAVQQQLDLENNPESYARSEYLMKKDNETVFVIKTNPKEEK
jgi:cell division protein FtsB